MISSLIGEARDCEDPEERNVNGFPHHILSAFIGDRTNDTMEVEEDEDREEEEGEEKEEGEGVGGKQQL